MEFNEECMGFARHGCEMKRNRVERNMVVVDFGFIEDVNLHAC